MTNESKASRNFVNSLFWSCTPCNLRFWKNDRTSGIVRFLQFHRIEQRHHGSIWWTVIFRTILGFFPQAPLSLRCRCLGKCALKPAYFARSQPIPLKVAHGIAALARHGINKLVQAASADPNTEFCSILSVSSPCWSLEKMY